MQSRKLNLFLILLFLICFFVVDMPVNTLWNDQAPVVTAGPNCDGSSGNDPGGDKDKVGAPEPSLFYLLGIGAAALAGYSIYNRKKKQK